MLKVKINSLLDYIQPTKYIVSSEEYSNEFNTPVLTAGDTFLLGYTNDKDGIYNASKHNPIILFDDFTTAIKWVDFPFKVKSSACKIIVSKTKTNLRYCYYAMKAMNFDHLQHKRYWISEYSEQLINDYEDENSKIVAELDNITDTISKKEQVILNLDELIKSRFIEMFENKGFPILKWNEVFNTKTGKLDSNAMVPGGQYPFFTCAKEVFSIDNFAFDQEALLLAGNNAAGKYDVKYYKGKFNAYQRTYVLDLKQDWSYQLFRYQLEDKLEWLREQSKGSNTRYITLKILGDLEFIIPPKKLQNEFESFSKMIDKSKVVCYSKYFLWLNLTFVSSTIAYSNVVSILE